MTQEFPRSSFRRLIAGRGNTDKLEPEPPIPPSLRVLLHVGSERAKPIVLQLAERLVLGRVTGDEGEKPAVDLNRVNAGDYGVSRLHAAILYQDRALFVEDLGSRNGTRINGLELIPNQPVRLRNGDELELGKLRIVVKLVHSPQ